MNSNLRHWSPFGSDNLFANGKLEISYIWPTKMITIMDHRNMETFCIKGLRNSKNSEARLF